MTKKTIKLNEKQFEEINKKIDEEKHNQFVKSLNKNNQSVLEETKKLIEKAESNLLDTENTNLHIVKNISVDLKNILPLDNFFQGTDHEKLADFKWSNALLKTFNNKKAIRADVIPNTPIPVVAIRQPNPEITIATRKGTIILPRSPAKLYIPKASRRGPFS